MDSWVLNNTTFVYFLLHIHPHSHRTHRRRSLLHWPKYFAGEYRKHYQSSRALCVYWSKTPRRCGLFILLLYCVDLLCFLKRAREIFPTPHIKRAKKQHPQTPQKLFSQFWSTHIDTFFSLNSIAHIYVANDAKAHATLKLGHSEKSLRSMNLQSGTCALPTLFQVHLWPFVPFPFTKLLTAFKTSFFANLQLEIKLARSMQK